MTRKARIVSALLIATLTLASNPNLLAQDASHKLSAMDEFQIQLPTDPQISPDGKRIVYVRRFADPMTDKRYSNLWIINTDGTDHRPLTTGNRSDASPRWSPDGMRLAYLSDADGKQQLYVRWMDTGQTARITNLDQAPDAIAWSPDGKMLSFSSLVLGKGPQIADLPAPPSGAKWADPPAAYNRLVYRFNGAGYLKPGFMQIFVVDSEGGAPRQVSNGNFPNGGNEFGPSRASWTPDGKYLIVSVNRHPESDHEYFDDEVYEFSVADGSLRPLTNRKGPDNSPTVSPDGKLIAYTGYDDRYQGHQTTKLYLMNRDGTNSHSLSDKLDRDIQDPQWAPDNSGVYFRYDDQGDSKIGFYPVAGGVSKKIAEHLASTLGAGGSGTFSLSRTGTIALTNLAGSSSLDYFDSSTPPANCTDAIVQQEVQKVITAQGKVDYNAIYEVFIPSGSYSSSGTSTSCGGPNLAYCAYHSHYVDGAGKNVKYSIEPWAGCSGCQAFGNTSLDQEHFVCHETREAVTDALGNAWFDRQGNEADDKCAWTPSPFIGTGGFGYQYEWSNANSGCIRTR